MMVCADVMDWAEGYKGEPFHALLCDPPYNFQFMGKDWDNAVAMHPETWIVLAKHLYPGAFIFAFGGARTYHRLAVALEDAGLRIHPAIGWVNGQGFPKSTRIDTQVDKAAGKLGEREVVGRYQLPDGKEWNLTQADDNSVEAAPGTFTASGRRTLDIEVPATPLAQAWEGHRYGGQVLKPCLEFIAVTQKPYEGKPIDDITGSGAGTLWVNGGRIPTGDNLGRLLSFRQGWKQTSPAGSRSVSDDWRRGRWPSNFILQHISPEICSDCNGAGGIDFPTWYARERKSGGTLANWRELTGGVSYWICLKCNGEGVVGGCRQVGMEKVKGGRIEKPCEYKGDAGPFGNKGDRPAGGIGDENGMETVVKWECAEGCPASQLPDGKARYFFQSDWNHEITERLDHTNPAFYCAKASRQERDIGLHKLSLQTFNRVNPGGLEHEPRWAPTEVRCNHPTMKPITLTRYLATLLLPPDLYSPRRLLVPFAGVASEMIGAYLAGWEEIVGIEMSQEYCDIGEMRLKWWKQASESAGMTDVKGMLKWAKKQL